MWGGGGIGLKHRKGGLGSVGREFNWSRKGSCSEQCRLYCQAARNHMEQSGLPHGLAGLTK